QDAGIRFAFEEETEALCDQLLGRNIRAAQSNPISFLQGDLMSGGRPVADSDIVLIAGKMTHFDHIITIKSHKKSFLPVRRGASKPGGLTDISRWCKPPV